MSPSSEVSTILVLTSGDCTGLNFTRSLKHSGRYRTIGLDRSFDDHVMSEADERILLTTAVSRQLVEVINDICSEQGVDLIYGADTDQLLDLASRERENLGALTFLPSYEDHMLAEDKWRTCELLATAGLPVPETTLICDRDDLRAALARHGSVWLRRTMGSGGAGSLATTSFALAHAWIAEAGGWGRFTAAEHLSSRTATFSAVWWQGELVASQLRERIAWKYKNLAPSGVTGITSGQRTFWDRDLHDLAVRCVMQVMDQPHGAVGVDFTFDHEGNPRVTEIQPARFYCSMEFLTAVGINLPDIYCRLALGIPLPDGLSLINPIRESFYWYKAVDKEPLLMTQKEVNQVETLARPGPC